MKEIKGEPFGVIEVETEEELEQLKADCGTEEDLQLAIFKKATTDYFKQLLPLLNRNSFGYYGEQVEIQNELARLREIEEVQSDNLLRAWQVVGILKVVYENEDFENINLSLFLECLFLLLEHNIMTPYLEEFVETYKTKYSLQMGFLNSYEGSIDEYEVSFGVRNKKAAETIQHLLTAKHLDLETEMLLDDLHFYLITGKTCQDLGRFWKEQNI